MRTSCFSGRQPDPQHRPLPRVGHQQHRCLPDYFPHYLAKLALLGLALSLSSLPCQASLGGAPSDFGRATVRHTSALAGASSYRVETSVLDNGTTVREFVANGVVFAVAWQGPLLPDLRELLGRHFSVLTSATAHRPQAGGGQVGIDQGDVAIVSTGHMRAFAGRAWVKSQLPAGFATDEIK